MDDGCWWLWRERPGRPSRVEGLDHVDEAEDQEGDGTSHRHDSQADAAGDGQPADDGDAGAERKKGEHYAFRICPVGSVDTGR